MVLFVLQSTMMMPEISEHYFVQTGGAGEWHESLVALPLSSSTVEIEELY